MQEIELAALPLVYLPPHPEQSEWILITFYPSHANIVYYFNWTEKKELSLWVSILQNWYQTTCSQFISCGLWELPLVHVLGWEQHSRAGTYSERIHNHPKPFLNRGSQIWTVPAVALAGTLLVLVDLRWPISWLSQLSRLSSQTDKHVGLPQLLFNVFHTVWHQHSCLQWEPITAASILKTDSWQQAVTPLSSTQFCLWITFVVTSIPPPQNLIFHWTKHQE